MDVNDIDAAKPTGPACASALRVRLSDSGQSQQCYTDTGYSFSSLYRPKANDLPFLCKSAACKTLIDLARSVAPTECIIDDVYDNYLYQDVLNPIIRQCANISTAKPTTNASGNATAAPSHNGETALTATWTVAPTVTPVPTTSTPLFGNSSFGSDSGSGIPGWWIACAAFIVLIAIGKCIYHANKKSSRVPVQQQSQYLVAGHGNDNGGSSTPVPVVYLRVDEDAPRRSQPHPSAPTLSATPAYQVAPPKPSAPTMPASSASQNVSSTDGIYLSKIPLLQDEAIVAVRVPFDKITFGKLLNRGGFGEVYSGTYKGDAVAIKQLLPERRSDPNCINSFLDEAKLMSSFEHERIVSFVGVAWDKVSDMCVLTEFMEGGDLRSLLARYDQESRPEGFDRIKIQIALHVAHALTYMHSLQPIVLHRDLKSSNILLSQGLNAKVTDFGISRTLAGATMTRGVGTSLWMAPEIMMGGRYDEKADIFSFGVVLSELDSNKLPYASHVDSKTNHADLMQRVAQGRLMVDFSYESDPDIVSLGRDCVAVDPQDRPTAAEALHRIHQVLRQYQQYTLV